MVERSGWRSSHWCALPFIDRWGQLQLAFPVPLPILGRRGESGHLQEGVTVLLGRNNFQSSSPTNTAGLGCGPLFQGRFLGSNHVRPQPVPTSRQNGETMYIGHAKDRRQCSHDQLVQAKTNKRMVAFVHQNWKWGPSTSGTTELIGYTKCLEALFLIKMWPSGQSWGWNDSNDLRGVRKEPCRTWSGWSGRFGKANVILYISLEF